MIDEHQAITVLGNELVSWVLRAPGRHEKLPSQAFQYFAGTEIRPDEKEGAVWSHWPFYAFLFGSFADAAHERGLLLRHRLILRAEMAHIRIVRRITKRKPKA